MRSALLAGLAPRRGLTGGVVPLGPALSPDARHAGGVGCPATGTTGALWPATTRESWQPRACSPVLAPIRVMPRAARLRGGAGGCGCGSSPQRGEELPHVLDRLLHGHPLLLASGPAGDLDHALGQVAGADADPAGNPDQLGIPVFHPGPLVPVVEERVDTRGLELAVE